MLIEDAEAIGQGSVLGDDGNGKIVVLDVLAASAPDGPSLDMILYEPNELLS